jgi:hypothetical protein
MVLAVGAMNAKHLRRRADDAWARCDPTAPGNPVPVWDLPDTDPIVAMQAETVARAAETACYEKLATKVPSKATISASEKWPHVVAAIIAILGALPWAWYFLLRRIAELRAAISGHPPSE